jgi:hypothetical protein
MADKPQKLFDLMETEVEPTDEQLAKLAGYMTEALRQDSHEPEEQSKT